MWVGGKKKKKGTVRMRTCIRTCARTYACVHMRTRCAYARAYCAYVHPDVCLVRTHVRIPFAQYARAYTHYASSDACTYARAYERYTRGYVCAYARAHACVRTRYMPVEPSYTEFYRWSPSVYLFSVNKV